MSRPTVSIVIATYNQIDYLPECIESCLAQTYSNIEIVITDDASTDGTVDFLRQIKAKEKKIELVFSKTNTGVTANFNRGLKAAKGDWVKVLAGDDRLPFDSIRQFVNAIKDQKKVLFVSDLMSFDGKSGFGRRISQPTWFFDLDQVQKLKCLCFENPLNIPGLFLSRVDLETLDYYDERFEMIEDYPFWLKAIRKGYRFDHIDTPLVEYRRNVESLTKGNDKIGNLRYILSLLEFYKREIWPVLSWTQWPRFIDKWSRLKQKEFGIRFCSNRRGVRYALLKVLSMPLRFYSGFASLRTFLLRASK